MSKKVLVVDDDELTVHLITSRLQDNDYLPMSAGNGTDALKLVIKEKPDFVIMDIMLPDMQGSDVIKSFKNYPEIPKDIKVVFLSGIISQSDQDGETIRVGEKFYPAISKPVDFDQLFSYFS